MAEIRTPVTKAISGVTHVFGHDEYLITERHTLSDILRFLIQQAGGPEEVRSLLDGIERESQA